jgi:hypothetical protein
MSAIGMPALGKIHQFLPVGEEINQFSGRQAPISNWTVAKSRDFDYVDKAQPFVIGGAGFTTELLALGANKFDQRIV